MGLILESRKGVKGKDSHHLIDRIIAVNIFLGD